MIIKLKKLYPHQGFLTARARDYQIQNCIDGKQDLHFQYQNKTMTIPYAELQAKIVVETGPYQSMFNPNQQYMTLGYQWRPNHIPTEEEKLKELSKLVL